MTPKSLSFVTKIGGKVVEFTPHPSEGAVKTVNAVSPDGNGNVAISDYITSVTISGHTITYTRKDGTRGIFRG